MAKQFSYYKYNILLSFNAVYNFLVGGRGLGKTYGLKEIAIKAALNKGEEFIYLRRYKNELAAARNTFFADIAHKFPRWEFRINGNRAEASLKSKEGDKKRQWVTIGYFIALSTAQSQKSVSFPLVKRIIFDEFIIEKGNIRYLPDEAKVFNNFYSTVDRWQDKTRVFFLANSVSIMNPYFIEYDIRPDQEGEYFTKAGGFIACHFPDSAQFKSEVFQTRFGKFIAGTEYADYAVGNSFGDNHNHLIKTKSPDAKYVYTLETPRGTFSVWNDMRENEWYAQRKRPKGSERIFTLIPENMSENKIFVTFSDNILGHLRGMWRSANMYFDEQTTRNAFAEVFKR